MPDTATVFARPNHPHSTADTICVAENEGSSLNNIREAIISCTKEVFRCMLQWEVQDISDSSNPQSINDDTTCCGIVGLSGPARGSVVVNFPASVAMAATEGFLGSPPNSVDSDVVDTVGELTNMIGGSSKDSLPLAGILLGLPTVIVGKSQSIAFDQGVQMEFFQFSTPHGNFTVEIAFCAGRR